MYGITETTVHVTYRPLDAGRSGGRARQRDRRAHLRICSVYVLDARRAPGSGRRARRDVRRRRRRGARLPQPARADGRALRRRPVRPRRAARLYRTGDLARQLPGRRPRVPRPHRPPGEDPRLPHRAGRDRGRARPAPRGARGGGAGARGRARRPAARRLSSCPDAAAAPRPKRAARLPATHAARVHGAGGLRRCSERSRSPPTARSTAARCPRPSASAPELADEHRRPAHAGRDTPWRRSGPRCCASTQVGVERQLLRAGRRLHPQHPGRRPRRPGRAAPHPAPALPAPDDR